MGAASAAASGLALSRAALVEEGLHVIRARLLFDQAVLEALAHVAQWLSHLQWARILTVCAVVTGPTARARCMRTQLPGELFRVRDSSSSLFSFLRRTLQLFLDSRA